MKKRFIFAALSLALMLAMTGCTNTNIPAKDDDNVTNSSKDDRDDDEVDIVYTYCENYGFDGATSYRFAFEKDYLLGIEDGTYDLVLCSSDNEEIGKVLFQIGLEKKGDEITLDYENEK